MPRVRPEEGHVKPAHVSWPAPAGHPPVVGGYVVRGVRLSERAGSALDATDSSRGPVVVVLLCAGAGQDGAARDRFTQAVGEQDRRHPGSVLDVAGLTARPPWVALAPQSADSLAGALLGSALPPDADETPRAGPRFRLPWFGGGGGVSWAPWLGTKIPPGWRRLWWLIGLLALLALVGLLLSMCEPPAPPGPGGTGPPTPARSEPVPDRAPSPSPQPGDRDGQSSNSRRA